MALSIDKAIHAVEVTLYANLKSPNNLYHTPMFFGTHGIGKSQMILKLADKFNGYGYTIDCSLIKEAELPGMPIVVAADDGSMETNYAPHYLIRKIQSTEKEIKEKLKNDKEQIEKVQKILETDKTGDELAKEFFSATGEKRLQLFFNREGLFKPIFILLDEINRTSREVNQEMMNFTLNRTINGYDLPWYVQIIGAANPSGGAYTNEDMDPAQIDRIYIINVYADVTEWLGWARQNGINDKVILFLSDFGDKFFQMTEDEISQGQQKPNPSPRSWHMVSDLLNLFEDSNINYRLKTSIKDKKFSADDLLWEMIEGKIGREAAVAFRQYIADNDNFIKPVEIFTGKGELSLEVTKKISRMNTLRRSFLVDNVLEFLQENIEEMINKNNKALDNELFEFFNLLDQSNKLEFATGIVSRKTKSNQLLFTVIVKNKEKLPNITKEIISIADNYFKDSELVADN